MSNEVGRVVEVAPSEVLGAGMGVAAALVKAELDQQIATAKQYPRSVSRFIAQVESLATASESVAESCIYAIPREGKTIEGPSARLAEIVAYAWGNCRAGARVLDDAGDFVTAQGAFVDLERNVGITYEVRRRIVDKYGRRYSPDMVAVTANAACSIALRNAVFKGVPKAYWEAAFNAAAKTVAGSVDTLATKRKAALEYLKTKFGVDGARVFAALGVGGEDDVNLDHLLLLRGIITALKEGDTTADEAFPKAKKVEEERGGLAALASRVSGESAERKATPAAAGAPRAAREQHAGAEGAATAATAQTAASATPAAEVQQAAAAAQGELRPMCARCTNESTSVVDGVAYCDVHAPAKKKAR